jgi:hypothetical protein
MINNTYWSFTIQVRDSSGDEVVLCQSGYFNYVVHMFLNVIR